LSDIEPVLDKTYSPPVPKPLPAPLPTGERIAEERAREQPFELDVYTAAELSALPDPPASDYLLGPYALSAKRGRLSLATQATARPRSPSAWSLRS
jgi:hypothetical protein